MWSLVTNHEAKTTKEFETLFTNLEKLVANISCGHPKFVLMKSNFDNNSRA